MNIAEYAKEKVQAAEAKVAASKAATKAIEADIKGLEVKSRELKTTRDRLIAEDIDKTAVEEKLRGVEAKIAACAADLKLKNDAVEAALAEREVLKPLEELTELCIKKIKVSEIPEIQSAHELLKHFEVHLKFEDQRATACSFWWLSKTSYNEALFELPLASKEPRGRATLIPEALEWIPDEWLPVKGSRRAQLQRLHNDPEPLKKAADRQPQQLYYIPAEDSFKALNGKASWLETERKAKKKAQDYSWQQTEYEDKDVRKEAKICEGHTPLIEALLNDIKNIEINLSGKNEIPYFDDIANLVIAATQPIGESPYVENKVAQTTLEIEKIVGPFMEKFVNAPWTENTTGILANFKYYCEQRERPRFHNLSIEGLYGFRLRTRDHSWIQGKIYIVPQSMDYAAPDFKVPEIPKENGSWVLVRMGRMILKVSEYR